MDINELKSRIKSLRLGGCYVFAGEEDYLKRYYLSSIRDALVGDPTLAAFNHAVFEGAEINFAAVQDAIKAPPVFAEYKLIEWRYPSFVKMKENELALFEDTLDLLCEYPYATLCFIVTEGDIDLGTAKKESRFVKRFKDKLNLFNFPKSTDAQLLSWLKKHFDAYSIKSSVSALNELIFRSGHSMSVLKSEVDKLAYCVLARGGDTVTDELVREVASTTTECDTYALSNAIIERNKAAAYFALEEMKAERLDPLMILGMLERTYSELVNVLMLAGDGLGSADIVAATGINAYRVKLYLAGAGRFTKERAARILEELVRVDTGAKFGGVTGYPAIEIFIGKCV